MVSKHMLKFNMAFNKPRKRHCESISSSDDEEDDGEDYEDESDDELKSTKRNVSQQSQCDDSLCGNTSSTSSSGRTKKFCPAWRNKHKWLRYDIEENVMYCELCRNGKMKNPYSHGTSNFNYTNLAQHCKSADHKRMVLASVTQPITVAFAHAITKANAALTAASRNVYWLAKEEVATYKYSSLNYLNKLQGCAAWQDLNVAKNAQYTSYHIAEEMQDTISSCIEEDIDRFLNNSLFFGLLLDESTDISSCKNLIVYIRLIVNHGIFETHFFKLLEVECQVTGQNLYSLLKESRKIPISKCVGLATDGARAMTGKENVLAALMKKDNPYLVSVHCIAHRLALAASQLVKDFPYQVKFQCCLVSIYSYFKHSATHTHNLQEIEKVLEDPVLKYQPIYEVRWMSLHSAVQAASRTLKSLMTFLENEATSIHDPLAKGIFTRN
jgi:hypothetical protein